MKILEIAYVESMEEFWGTNPVLLRYYIWSSDSAPAVPDIIKGLMFINP